MTLQHMQTWSIKSLSSTSPFNQDKGDSHRSLAHSEELCSNIKIWMLNCYVYFIGGGGGAGGITPGVTSTVGTDGGG